MCLTVRGASVVRQGRIMKRHVPGVKIIIDAEQTLGYSVLYHKKMTVNRDKISDGALKPDSYYCFLVKICVILWLYFSE